MSPEQVKQVITAVEQLTHREEVTCYHAISKSDDSYTVDVLSVDWRSKLREMLIDA